MTNEERDKALYRYPDSTVLRNKLDIRDADALRAVEARLVADRIEEGAPTGRFDLDHLRGIHHHLFQDVYEWAGETRKVDIHKGGSAFHPASRIEMGMADVHKRLAAQDFLKGLPPDRFAGEAAEFIGDVNRLHPFREGNGRTQLQYLKQLGAQAGHAVDLTRFERETWIRASIEANKFQSERMAECIRDSLASSPKRDDIERLRELARARREAGSKSRDRSEEP